MYKSQNVKVAKLKGSLSMDRMSKRTNYLKRKEGSIYTEDIIETLSSFPENN